MIEFDLPLELVREINFAAVDCAQSSGQGIGANGSELVCSWKHRPHDDANGD